MKYNLNNETIKIILNDLGEEYKDMLLEKAIYDSGELDVDNISTSDLIQLDIQVKTALSIDQKDKKRKSLYKLISLTGILYMLIGLFILLIKELENYLFEDPLAMISISCALIGMMLSILPIFIRNIPKQKNKINPEILEFKIINTWKELESIVYQLVPMEKHRSFRTMLDYLENIHILDTHDLDVIKELLQMRNEIVHGHNNITIDKAKIILKESNNSINKLKKLL